MKYCLSLLLLFAPLLCFAQTTTDDFSDGDLLNPEWTGDTPDFVVTDGRLRLMATGAGSSRLQTLTPVEATAEQLVYSFLVEMDFAPSGSNYSEIFLRDSQDAQRVITLRFGGISGSDDALEISFSAGGNVEGTLGGAAGALGSSPAVVRFELKRTGQADNYTWSLATNYTGGSELTEEDTFSTTERFAPDIFEILATYTSTRADRFSFDDLIVSATTEDRDTVPPTLTEVEIISANLVRLDFSENLAPALAQNINNYSLSNPSITVTGATLNGSELSLELSGNLPLRETVTLTIDSIRDEAGNLAQNLTAALFYDPTIPASAGNLIITEFMPDPNPVVTNLPDEEYVEIQNLSDVSVSLEGVGLSSGGSPATLGGGSIGPGEYLLLVPNGAGAEYTALGIDNVREMSLPSLTNGGDEIALEFDGQVLFGLRYTTEWYNDEERNGGGYSIEFTGTDPADCGGLWRASLDPSGGTPGRANSVLGMPADQDAPELREFSVAGQEIVLIFNEPIIPDQFGPSILTFDGPSITAVEVFEDNELTLFLSEQLPEGGIFTLTLLPQYQDCAGNRPTDDLTLQLANPVLPAPGEVVINEVLFNPASGGSDYLELYNCSDKVFQIEGWVLSNTQSTSSTSASREVSVRRLFLPGEHLTFSADPDVIIEQYQEVDPTLMVDQSLPSLPDDEGNITVTSAEGEVLDAFDYSDDLHSELLGPDDGVALERLRYKGNSQEDGNWFSAASTEGFGTPTRPNSQNRDALMPTGDQILSLVSETFSPDGDSFEDILEIIYVTPQPGYLARIRIFDAQGRLVRTLRRIELLGSQGTLRWDGADDEGLRAKRGVYVLLAELFTPAGDAVEEKLVAVLAGSR
ncbi:lamin tail domain-containing protein [Lewinella sp. W8]|uniref:lamin tail domain-containing protein n=1 Tax=Lewinella sp. W8 TaxID=2528208 RepID=UPI001566968F|nr:lamin tail domain-containing protein [Lewinella sp. W8]